MLLNLFNMMFSVLNLFILLNILSYIVYSLGIPKELSFAVSTIFYFTLRIINTLIQAIFMPEEPERTLFEIFEMFFITLKDRIMNIFPVFQPYDINVVV